MSTEATRLLAQNYLDVLNRALSTRNFDLLATIAATDLIDHGAGVGLESWAKIAAMTLDAFPDAQLSTVGILADGDMAAIRSVLHGTHLGDALGFPATGKAIALNVVDIVRFQDGLAAERWLFSSDREMMEQLGMAPAPEA
ncbi:ester cyclase [Ottowia sp.]|uniref:ester cyclase n=1 Tax=Ottowia sp. TaxID=1898956 RepID=UPI002B58A480|nr:ester cyclase [Ottowia sp.]HNR84929.1 ester cyclase [Ottowia sp.]